MYTVISEKFIRMKNTPGGVFSAVSLVHIVVDSADDIPAPLDEWETGSRCDVTGGGGATYMLNNARNWEKVNFYNRGRDGGGFDPDEYYTKPQTDERIAGKVAEIVANAPEDFDTLKEISDWIQENTRKIQNKVDKVSGMGLSQNSFTNEEKTKLAGLENYDDSALQSAVSALSESGAKNLLKNNYAGQTVTNANATFVSDENGVISVSGTVGTTWGTVYILGSWSGTETMLDCSDGDYILSIESTTDNVRVTLNDRTSETVSYLASIDGNGSKTFSGKITAVAVGAKTGTFENDTIKIMIRRAGIADGAYVPYAPTNRELYEMILALQQN